MRTKTLELVQHVRRLFDCDIAATKRLMEIDNAIWKLGMITKGNIKFRREVSYKILGISSTTSTEETVKVDANVMNKIIDFYEKEYSRQARAVEEIILKMEKQ